MPAEGELWSIRQAATYKGVHYQTVRRAIASGTLPSRKVGQAVVLAAADVKAWAPKYEHAPRTPSRGRSPQQSESEETHLVDPAGTLTDSPPS